MDSLANLAFSLFQSILKHLVLDSLYTLQCPVALCWITRQERRSCSSKLDLRLEPLSTWSSLMAMLCFLSAHFSPKIIEAAVRSPTHCKMTAELCIHTTTRMYTCRLAFLCDLYCFRVSGPTGSQAHSANKSISGFTLTNL